MTFKVVEKKNHYAVHAHCLSRESAQRWIDENAVEYCAKGFFVDKSLTPDSFEIVSEDPLPLRRLRHHVSGAVERGEATAIEAMEATEREMQ